MYSTVYVDYTISICKENFVILQLIGIIKSKKTRVVTMPADVLVNF